MTMYCILNVLRQLPGVFDVDYVSGQLRHAGLMETIHLRKEGFPIRIQYSYFVERYCEFTLHHAKRYNRCFSEETTKPKQSFHDYPAVHKQTVECPTVVILHYITKCDLVQGDTWLEVI